MRPDAADGSCTAGRRPTRMTSVQAGEVEAVHRLTTEHVYDQQLIPVEGQTDVVLYGLPYVGPYNVELDHEPDPGHVPGARATSSTCTGAGPSSGRAGC